MKERIEQILHGEIFAREDVWVGRSLEGLFQFLKLERREGGSGEGSGLIKEATT